MLGQEHFSFEPGSPNRDPRCCLAHVGQITQALTHKYKSTSKLSFWKRKKIYKPTSTEGGSRGGALKVAPPPLLKATFVFHEIHETWL